MRKVFGLTMALVLTLTMSAFAGEVTGTVKAVDPSDQSIVLEDGTKLTVSAGQISGLAAGDQVRAVYEMEGGKNVVSGIDHHTVGAYSRGTFSSAGTPIDSMQAE